MSSLVYSQPSFNSDHSSQVKVAVSLSKISDLHKNKVDERHLVRSVNFLENTVRACSKMLPHRVSHWCRSVFLTSVSQHKKLVEGTLYEEVTSASYSENDISNSLKNGILYLEDPIDHVRVSECSAVSDSA